MDHRRALGRVEPALDLERPSPRHGDLPVAQPLGAPARLRAAPVLAREDRDLFVRRADEDPRGLVAVVAAHVRKPRLVALAHPPDHVGMLGGHVLHLQRVGPHVVELELDAGRIGVRWDAAGVDQLVPLRAGGTRPVAHRRVAAVPLEVERAVGPLDLAPLQQRQDAPPVELDAFRRLGAACLQQRGHDVDVRGDLFDLAPGLEARGPAHEERGADAPFVDAPLAGPHARVVALAVGAVVGQEDDDGVFGQAELVEPGQEPADVVVDVLDHAEDLGGILGHVPPLVAGGREVVGLHAEVFVGLGVLLGNLERPVGTVVGQVDEEGLAAVLPDVVDGRRGEDVGAVALGFDPLGIVQQRGVEVAVVRRPGGLAEPAAGVDERLLEALIPGPHRVAVAQVPLAEDGGAVARGAQHFGQGDLVGVHHRPAQVRVGHAGAVVVAAGHQGRPRGRADRADVERRDLDALPGELVEVRRLDDGVAVNAQVAVALVVGHHQNNVWPAGRVRCNGP